MKRILFAGALVLGAMGQALAADLPVPYTPPPPRAPAAYVPVVVPIYNWNGFYVGLNGGYGFGNSNWDDGFGDTSGNFNLSGGLAGGQIGWNYQMGQAVFGIEGDIDWSGIKGSTTAGVCVVEGVCQTSNNWLSTVRGRIGYAWDRVLVYGTAGGAFGNVKMTNIVFSDNSTEAGWAAGAGVEVGITENITAKAEYLFVDLSNGSCSPSNCLAQFSGKFDTSIVRAGINLKFSGF